MKIHAGALVGAACSASLYGGVAVGCVFTLSSVAATLASGSVIDVPSVLLLAALSLVCASLAALVAYFIGAIAFGIPTFLLLYHAGWMTPIHASLAGAVLSGLAGLLLTRGGATGCVFAGLVAIGGAVAGPVFRNTAYQAD